MANTNKHNWKMNSMKCLSLKVRKPQKGIIRD